MSFEQLQKMYAGDEYYWGREPNGFARLALGHLPEDTENRGRRAVDIGAGEGRDAVFFARHGLDVLAVDVASNGLQKALCLAREEGVGMRAEEGDVNTLNFAGPFHLVYSIGTIQYLWPENREERFAHFREQTIPGGIHALFAFVENPDLPPAPDLMEEEYLYQPGELPGYYSGWEVLHSHSFVFEDNSGGVPHRHAAEEYIFEKPA